MSTPSSSSPDDGTTSRRPPPISTAGLKSSTVRKAGESDVEDAHPSLVQRFMPFALAGVLIAIYCIVIPSFRSSLPEVPNINLPDAESAIGGALEFAFEPSKLLATDDLSSVSSSQITLHLTRTFPSMPETTHMIVDGSRKELLVAAHGGLIQVHSLDPPYQLKRSIGSLDGPNPFALDWSSRLALDEPSGLLVSSHVFSPEDHKLLAHNSVSGKLSWKVDLEDRFSSGICVDSLKRLIYVGFYRSIDVYDFHGKKLRTFAQDWYESSDVSLRSAPIPDGHLHSITSMVFDAPLRRLFVSDCASAGRCTVWSFDVDQEASTERAIQPPMSYGRARLNSEEPAATPCAFPPRSSLDRIAVASNHVGQRILLAHANEDQMLYVFSLTDASCLGSISFFHCSEIATSEHEPGKVWIEGRQTAEDAWAVREFHL